MPDPNRHNADTVGKLVDYPDLIVGSRMDGDRLDAYRNFLGQERRRLAQVEDREPRVGRVNGQEQLAVWRKANGICLSAFEIRESDGWDLSVRRQSEDENTGDGGNKERAEHFSRRYYTILWQFGKPIGV